MKKVGTGTVTVLPTVGVKVTLAKDKYFIVVSDSLKGCATKMGIEGVTDTVTIEELDKIYKVHDSRVDLTIATSSEMVNGCKKLRVSDSENKFLGFK